MHDLFKVPTIGRDLTEFGWTPGTDCSPTVQDAVDAGESLIFPGGREYLFESPVVISGDPNLSFFGEGVHSVLKAAPGLTNAQLFDISGSSNIRFENLFFQGRGPAASTANKGENAIYMLDCADVHIIGCKFTGFGGNVVALFSVDGMVICNNHFWKNEDTNPGSGSSPSGDIIISKASGYPISRDAVITGNRCMSNNREGIWLGSITASCVCNSNIVISKLDLDGSEPVNTADFLRKEGITITYHPDNDTGEPWDIACNGNVIRNAGWTGIYVAASVSTGNYDYDTDGVRATICGNTVAKCSMNVPVTADPQLHGGIVVRGIQQASVNGNNVHTIDPARTAQVHGANYVAVGIRVFAPLGTVDGVRRNALTINGNTIRDVGGRGVMTNGHLASIQATGNVITECDLPWESFNASSVEAEISLVGNTMIKTDAEHLARSYVCYISGTTDDPGYADGRIQHKPVLVGNRFAVKGPITASSEGLVYLSTDRAVVTGNWFEANEVAVPDGIGLWIAPFRTDAVRRANQFVIGDNHFRNLQYGMYLFQSGAPDYGPIVDQGSSYENVTNKYAVTDIIFPGHMVGDNVVVYRSISAAPTVGHWLAGDRIYDLTPAVGAPIGYVCTVSGNPGTWVALANL